MAFYETWHPNDVHDAPQEKGRLSAMIVTNNTFSAHWHDDIEIMYVIDGSIEVFVNGRSQIMRSGELVVCENGQIHSSKRSDPSSRVLYLIFNKNYLRTCAPSIAFVTPFLDARAFSMLGVPDEALKQMRSSLISIPRELSERKRYYDVIVERYLTIIISFLTRYAGCKFGDRSDASFNSPLIRKAILYLNENYMNAVSPEELGEKLSISAQRLSRLFVRFTGLGIREYLMKVRINYAKIALTNTSQSIISVALNCGFDSIRTFNRVFKEQQGVTPTQYRKLNA